MKHRVLLEFIFTESYTWKIFTPVKIHLLIDKASILGDPCQGQLVGSTETRNCGKNFGIEKLERLKGAPGERVLLGQFQTALWILPPDLAEKFFVFPLYYSAQSLACRSTILFVCSNTKYINKTSSLAILPASVFHGRKKGRLTAIPGVKCRMTVCPLSPIHLLCILWAVLCSGPLGLQHFVQVISFFFHFFFSFQKSFRVFCDSVRQKR